MSLKSIGRKASARIGRHLMPVKTHSPTLLMGAGVIGVTASVVLACRATLKLSEVLEHGEENLKKVDAAQDKFEEEELQKAAFGVKLKVAVDVAKLYAPSALLLGGSLTLIVASNRILNKRNAGLAAAYTVIDKSYKEYRGRVREELGEEKDFEFANGISTAEVVVDGKNGPETVTVSGLDQEAIENEDQEISYRRVFNRKNKNWRDGGNLNQFFLQMVQDEMNALLRLQKYVFLNDVYDALGFPRTMVGQVVGWVKNPKDGEGDGYIDFGVWNEGVYEGKKWLNGEKDAMLLEFNVDGPILGALPKV